MYNVLLQKWENILVMGRRRYNVEFKAKVALEAIKGEKTASGIAGEYGVDLRGYTIWQVLYQEDYRFVIRGFAISPPFPP